MHSPTPPSGATAEQHAGATIPDSTAPLRPPFLAAKPAERFPQQYRSLLRMLRYAWHVRAGFAASFVTQLLAIAVVTLIPLVTRAIVDGPVQHKDARMLWILGAVALGLGMAEALLIGLRRIVMNRPMHWVEREIRRDLYAKLQVLPLRFHGQWQSGQLLSRIMSDLSTLRRAMGFSMMFLVLNFIQISVVVGVLMYLYLPLGLVVVAMALPLCYTVYKAEQSYSRWSRETQERTGDVATAVEEAAHGLRTIKSFGRSEYAFQGFDAKAEALRAAALKKIWVSSRFFTLLDVLPNATLVIVMALGVRAVASGDVTTGTIVSFIQLMLSLTWPISSMGYLLAMMQEAVTASDRVCEIFDAPDDLPDGTQALVAPRGRLELDSVAFRFPDSESDVLKNVTLTVEPGETVALVGATGSGKTVLTSLIPRLYDVTAGSVRIDGVDVRTLTKHSLRTLVATAFEEPTLFSMSVRENLTLGREDASEEDIAQAVDVAQAHFVYQLPWGLETRIGEQGMSLSGGQRQRLALARAVLTQPTVVVLDDTLSALDVHTEKLVEDALRRVLVGVTALIVAHRASTVLLADKVALLHNGTITHVGTHAELLASVPAYRHLLSAEDEINPEIHSLGDGFGGRSVRVSEQLQESIAVRDARADGCEGDVERETQEAHA